jgi:hypothetical protein
MPSDVVKIRVKLGNSEAEVEAELSHIREAIELIPEVVKQLPDHRPTAVGENSQFVPPRNGEDLPAVILDKNDSLSEIVAKFFNGDWGRERRKLSDVRDALQSYGLNYPKQSVAVALMRLAKASRIRRFKADDGAYVYTSSTPTLAQQQLVPA